MHGQELQPRNPIGGSALYFGLAAVLGVVAIVGLVFLVLRPGSGSRASFIPNAPPGRTVHFAPIGDFPAADADALVDHYRDRFGLEVRLLPTLPLPLDAIDPARGQVIAERLAATIQAQGFATDPNAVIIGLTSEDMYIASKTWQYAYSLRVPDRFAIVSSARMNALGADPAQQMSRLQKIVTKQIGILYYGLPQSSDPTSVLYDNILGPRDLDRVTEDY